MFVLRIDEPRSEMFAIGGKWVPWVATFADGRKTGKRAWSGRSIIDDSGYMSLRNQGGLIQVFEKRENKDIGFG